MVRDPGFTIAKHLPEADDEGAIPPTYRFERRLVDRWPLQTAATAFRLDAGRFGAMHELKVLDYSSGGMGAVSSQVIEPGTFVSIGFAAPGRLARRGTVLRCTPSGRGYRVAIQFESRLAA